MFQVICIRDGVEELFCEVNTPEDANRIAKEQTAACRAGKDKFTKFRVIKKPPRPNVDWCAREKARFASGEYRPVVWEKESWWIKLNNTNHSAARHFAHASLKEPAKISFTKTPEHGALDRQTIMRPGAYLKQYFGAFLSAETIRAWAVKWSRVYDPEGVGTLKFATTPDEIEHVYVNGPESCMSGEACRYAGEMHPTRIYGAGDLAVAYLERSGDIVARVLCWPEKKIYTRIYGDGERLLPLLESEGYQNGRTDGALNGARMLHQEIPETRNAGRRSISMPYVDWHSYAHITTDGKYVRLGRRTVETEGTDFTPQSTGGSVRLELDGHCARCNTYTPSAERLVAVTVLDTTGLPDRKWWCGDCTRREAVRCEGCNTSRLAPEGIAGPRCTTSSGSPQTICHRCVARGTFVRCAGTCGAYDRPSHLCPTTAGPMCFACIAGAALTQAPGCGKFESSEHPCQCGPCKHHRKFLAGEIAVIAREQGDLFAASSPTLQPLPLAEPATSSAER